MKSFTLNANYLIFIIIIIQPILDILTSLSTTYQMPSLSIGAIIRSGLLFILAIYNFYYLFQMRSRLLILYLASMLTIALTIFVNILLKSPFHMMAEMSFASKTVYFIVLLFTVIILFDKNQISKSNLFRATNVTAIIIGISYWSAIATNTSMTSYRYGESGFSGWFFATNELSVTIIILLGLSLAHLHIEKSAKTWIAFLFMTSMLPMIGTKVTFLGGIIILLFYAVILLFQYPKQLFRQRSNIYYFAIVIIFFLAIPFSPATSNTKNADYMAKQQQIKMIASEKQNINHTLLSKILSSRDIYFLEKKNDFSDATVVRKMFGLGYAGDYRTVPKVIEMDFFDLFFSYGWIGTILLILPLLYIVQRLLTHPFNAQKLLLLLTVGLCFGFSFLAGHVLFAPSVMTYIAILFLVVGLRNEKKGWQVDASS